jgi:hypothetical protein
MQLLTGFLKVTTVFVGTFRCQLLLFVGYTRSVFGGSSVQQSVPAVDLMSDRGQSSSIFNYHLVGINVIWLQNIMYWFNIVTCLVTRHGV